MLCCKIGSVVTAVWLLGSSTAALYGETEEPAWKKEFRKTYGLNEEEFVRRVAPPYAECRSEYFRNRVRELYKRIKKDFPEAEATRDYSEYFTKFPWKDGWPDNRLMMSVVGVKPEEGAQLGQLLSMVTGFSATRTDGLGVVLTRKVTGDFVVQAGAAPEKLAAALEKILRRDCGLAVSLQVQEDEQKVYILTGKYEAHPLPGRKNNEIEIYASQLGDRTTGGGGSGSLLEFADHVERFIEAPVVLEEVAGAPKLVEWHFNDRAPFTKLERAQDHDPVAVTEKIADQTGLSVKYEKRRIKILVVDEDK